MLLASDLINPAFVGSRNPDESLAVEFYWNTVKYMNGKPVLDENGKDKKIPFIRISVPGNDTFMLDTPVREEHKKRFPKQWLYWQIQEGMTQGQGEIPGWSIDTWTEIEESQRRELKYLRFSVVEQVAGASDLQIQRLGIGGYGLREKARQALKTKAQAAIHTEIEARDAKIRELEEANQKRDAEMQAMKEQMAQLLAAPKVPPSVEAQKFEISQSTGAIPAVSARKKHEYTAEQRKAIGERLKAARAAKKK